MGEVKSSRPHRPLLLLAAWVSPGVPLAAVAVAMGLLTFSEGMLARHSPLVPLAVLGASALGGLLAVAGVCGVRANGALATLPGALLGLLVSGVVGAAALILWCLSGMPRC